MSTINDYIKIYRQDRNGILIDVREKEEVAQGKIPDSINIPLGEIDNATLDKTKTLYVYCRSGKRSGIAVDVLKSKGYNAINIGGILDYKEE